MESGMAQAKMTEVPEGRDTPSEDPLRGFSEDELLGFLRRMLLFRRFEEKAEEAYAIGKIGGFCHLHIGQEGSAAGCIGPLRDDDYVICGYREHTQALAKGMDPKVVMAELYGKAPGASAGRGGSMHVFGVDQAFMWGMGSWGGRCPWPQGWDGPSSTGVRSAWPCVSWGRRQ